MTGGNGAGNKDTDGKVKEKHGTLMLNFLSLNPKLKASTFKSQPQT